jgi:hypothetical protein
MLGAIAGGYLFVLFGTKCCPSKAYKAKTSMGLTILIGIVVVAGSIIFTISSIETLSIKIMYLAFFTSVLIGAIMAHIQPSKSQIKI